MFKNLKILPRLMIGFGALICIIAILAGSSLLSGTRIADATGESARVARIVIAAKDNLLLTRKARVLAWTYMATGDTKALQQMDESYAATEKQYVNLESLAKVRPGTVSEGDSLLAEFYQSYLGVRDNVRKMVKLKSSGVAMGSAEMAAAISDVGVAATKNAEATDKLSAFYNGRLDGGMRTVEEQVQQAITVSIGVGLASIIIGIGAALFIGRSIAHPITAMTNAMSALAHGDKSVTIPAVAYRDEVADMSRAMQVFKDNALRADQLAAEQRADQQGREARARIIEQLTGGFDQDAGAMLDGVSGAANDLERTAQSMSASAVLTNRQADRVAVATEQTSQRVSTVASAAEELASSIQEISRQVQQSNRVAGAAADEATRSSATVQKLSEGAQRIGEVVQLINDIASQTNLLALNATIEAARAGDAGKGFAVVAVLTPAKIRHYSPQMQA